MVQVNLTASTGLHSPKEFRNLVVKQADGAHRQAQGRRQCHARRRRLRDRRSAFDGKQAVYIGIQMAPDRQPARRDRGRAQDLSRNPCRNCRNGLHGAIVYDSTDFVNSSIHEVVRTLVEALVIVNAGGVRCSSARSRSVLIPMVAIPLSLIGAFTMMLAFGFSINLLTLLALVLAIGLVVDDAIIVVENVNRHLEEGQTPIRRRDPGRARTWPADHRDDRRADRGLCADRLPGRIDRRAVHRIRLHAGRRGDDIGRRGADAVADDGFAAAEGRTAAAPAAGRTGSSHSSTARFERLRRALPAAAARQPRLSAGDVGVRAARAVAASISSTAAPTANWRRRRTRASSLRSSTPAPDATLQQKLLYARQIYKIFAELPGDRARLPDRRARPVDRRHGAEALGRAQQDQQPSCSRWCSSN